MPKPSSTQSVQGERSLRPRGTGSEPTSDQGAASCGFDLSSLEQRRGRRFENVAGVRLVEVDRAVHLEDVAPSGGVACDVHTPEVEPEGGDRSQRERTRWERRIDWPADSSQGDVRAPLAGQGTALDRADDAAPRNDNAEVASGGFDESLHERAVATKPAPARNVVEPCLQLALIATAVHVTAPAAKRGFTTYEGGNDGTDTSRICAVRGCATPARPRRSAVESLSWGGE
jgi:hypothetical protein